MDADPTIDVIACRIQVRRIDGRKERSVDQIKYATVSAERAMLERLIKTHPAAMPSIWQMILLRCGIRVGAFRDVE
ncbi:MAG TPA: hypothetical protein PKX13_12075 [Acidiphilium sp.]|nr:hypothetical protein [Acidiphilium sp.]